MSITIEKLNKLDKDTYQIIDIRDKDKVQKTKCRERFMFRQMR